MLKRPTSISLGAAGSLAQTFDRAGRVTSDGRSLTSITGDAGTGTQAFSYDGLSRLTGSTGLALSRSYQYDLDGNRTRRVEGTTTTDFTFDRADQLVSQDIGAVHNTFDYDRYGNLTSGWDASSAQTTYAYDEAGRLTTISPPGGAASQVTFSLDALDRHATRLVNGVTTDTYAYLDATETAWQTGPSGATGSLLDAEGTRLAVKTGGTTSWLVFDLHGSVAGLCIGSTSLTDAYRFDGFGVQIAPLSGGTTNPFRYRGLLNVGADAVLGALLDMGARDYSPQLGAFTSEDSVQGGAANPLTMNRFLYALANPSTLVDPDGHMVDTCGGGACDAYVTPVPWKGLIDGGDCNQSCIDHLAATGGGGGGGGGSACEGSCVPSATEYVSPWALDASPDWQSVMEGASIACGKAKWNGASDACRHLTLLEDFVKQNLARFCAANAAVCQEIRQAQDNEQALALGLTLESVALVIAIADLVPGDEVAIGAGEGATWAARQSALQRLGQLTAIGEEGFLTVPATRWRGLTVIGHGPYYRELASEDGARYFRLPEQLAGALNRDEKWALNLGFLRETVRLREIVQLAGPVELRGGYFDREVQYLLRSGYQWDPSDALRLIPQPIG